MNVLFSMVGGSDPIRDNYDGPFLHIIRHYPIDKIYLFFTKEMSDRDKKDDRYVRTIKSIDDTVEVEKIHSDIENPHQDEPLSSKLKKTLEDIQSNHEEDFIYFNLSSGTPQMRAVLSNLIIITDVNGQPLEVSTPKKKQNTSPTNQSDYSVEEELEFNMDSHESTDTRVFETDLIKYRQLMVFGQVCALVDKYEYLAAIDILKKSKLETSPLLMNALNHAYLRFQLKREEANNRLGHLPEKQAQTFKVGDSDFEELIEYFMVIDIKQKKSVYADMVLMLEPFTIRFFEMVFKEKAGLNVKRTLMTKRELDPDKIKGYDSDLAKKMDAAHAPQGFKKGDSSVRAYHIFFKHLFREEDCPELFKLAHALFNIKGLRNKLAHDLRATDDQEINKTLGMNSNYLISLIRDQLKKILKAREKDLSIYSSLNTIIKEELNTLV